MAVNIEATKSSASANSYATVAEADTLLDTIYMAGEWAELEADDKARLLIMASDWLDRLTFAYDKFNPDQALKFPVNVAGAEKGFPEAKKAAILQAFYLYRNYENINAASDEAIQSIKTQTLGSVSLGRSTVGLNVFRKYDPEVPRLLGAWLNLRAVIGRG